MKKFLFLAAALIAMGCGMSSCSNEAEVTEQTEQTPKLTKLTFTVAQDAQTRVAWGGTNNRTPMFENGDKVSLFSASNNNVELTASVDAVGNVTLSGEGYSGDTDLYFVYPYEESAEYNSGLISGGSTSAYHLVHNNVTAEIDKYPHGALSMAKSTDGGATAITFQGLMTIFKFTATDYYDCGQIKVRIGEGSVPYSVLKIDVNNCKITGGNFTYLDMGFDFEEGKTYYMAVPPFEMPASGRIYMEDDSHDKYPIFEGAKTFVAGKIYNLKCGSTGGSVDFTKNDWTASGNTLTATKDGITITLTRSSSNDIMKASTGAITFPSATEDETMTVKVTNAADAQLPCKLTNSATDESLTGDGSWTLTYSSSPVGWLTTGGLAFIGGNIPKSAIFTVEYE